jgi:hypothetical protein
MFKGGEGEESRFSKLFTLTLKTDSNGVYVDDFFLAAKFIGCFLKIIILFFYPSGGGEGALLTFFVVLCQTHSFTS